MARPVKTPEKKTESQKTEVPPVNPGAVPETTGEPERQIPTTMKIKPETKGRLENLKEVFKLSDLDAVVNQLIDTLPKRLSTEQEVHLVMPASKYRWLMAHQDTCDCRACLNDAKV